MQALRDIIAPMSKSQSAKSHSAVDPAFVFFLLPFILANLVLSVYYTIHQWPIHSRAHLWWIVSAVAFFLLAGTTRRYGLKLQDRIIRLEERTRLAALLPASELSAAHSLTLAQIIALRFASDDELPALVRRTLAEHLTPAQIKQSITSWRPDHHRI